MNIGCSSLFFGKAYRSFHTSLLLDANGLNSVAMLENLHKHESYWLSCLDSVERNDDWLMGRNDEMNHRPKAP